jgi:hypothetical protein
MFVLDTLVFDYRGRGERARQRNRPLDIFRAVAELAAYILVFKLLSITFLQIQQIILNFVFRHFNMGISVYNTCAELIPQVCILSAELYGIVLILTFLCRLWQKIDQKY